MKASDDNFDELCRLLATAMPRRKALKLFFTGLLAGGGLMAISASVAQAKSRQFRSDPSLCTFQNCNNGCDACGYFSCCCCDRSCCPTSTGTDACCPAKSDFCCGNGYCCPTNTTCCGIQLDCCVNGCEVCDPDKIECVKLHCPPADNPSKTLCCPDTTKSPVVFGNCCDPAKECCKGNGTCVAAKDPVGGFMCYLLGGFSIGSLKTLDSNEIVSQVALSLDTQGASSDPTTLTAYSNITGSLQAFNYGTRTLITCNSFTYFFGQLTGGGDLIGSGEGMAQVNGVATPIAFNDQNIGGVPSIEIFNATTQQMLAGGTGEPGHSSLSLTLVQL